MKKNQLKNVLRKIVREEVAVAINEVIREMKSPIIPQDTKIEENVRSNNSSDHYTNNSVLNRVLNETADNQEWKLMGDSPYTSNKINDVMSHAHGEGPNGNLASSMGVDPNDPSVSFLNKDYSKLMSKIKEEK